MSSPFTPFLDLYSPGAHPILPWWSNQPDGINQRWVRADRTWEVRVSRNTTGDIVVKRQDLGELDDETHRLRSDRGFHPFTGNVPYGARGAVIERVSLSMNQSGSDFTDWFVPQWPGDLPTYVDAMLLRLEREYPMPRPPIWAGQCWSLQDVGTRPIYFPSVAHDAEEKPWVGALLYGPTKYGRDVPWLHPSLLPASITER